MSVAPTPPRAETKASGDFVVLRCGHDLRISAPANLHCLSTFVLLEQGKWFEREVDFLYRFARPGMIALDIGANIGVYTLTLASILGKSGKVFAYEPGSDNRRHLERSLQLNQSSNVSVSAAALSNFCGQGILKLGKSGELHQLVAAPESGDLVETIEVSTLDAELQRWHWPRVDFVKLDAEGQEEAILDGGKDFFRRHSPLVMFEAIHGETFNGRLLEMFRDLGFELFRLVGDSSMLVPVGDDDVLDNFDLNYFAARPELAARLAAAGLLAVGGGSADLSDDERIEAVAKYCALSLAQSLEITADDVAACQYSQALTAYSAYRFLPELSPDRRYALLQAAYAELTDFCQNSNSAAALSTLSRVARDCGFRVIGRDILNHLCISDNFELDFPFYPPAAYLEDHAAHDSDQWLQYSVRETFEIISRHSVISASELDTFEFLASHELATPAAIRRAILLKLAWGQGMSEVEPYFTRLNAVAGSACVAWSDIVRSLANRRQ